MAFPHDRCLPHQWPTPSLPWLAVAAAFLTLLPAAHAAPSGPEWPAMAPSGAMGAGGRSMGWRSADAHFIVMMIPHHDGAIAMAELALRRAKRPQIKALAARIQASQTAENAQMRRWYRQWYGTDVPTWSPGNLGPGMGMGGMPGMTTSLEALRNALDVDRAFIEQMIPHHRMGVMMASHAQWHTQQPELRRLQAAMVRVQSEEIRQMEQWYRQWYGPSAR